jgi:CheY-like chemotaxis protein
MADILVIDDDDLIIELVRELLADAGHQVRSAGDGEAGLAEAAKAPPALVILDMNMPRMDGYTLAKRLRNNPATRTVKLLALTAHANASEYDDAYKAGCDGFVAKPLDAGRLYEKVKELLG